jgi:ferredoxin-NADP reductase
MAADHEFHALAVRTVVDETADTRSFVLEVPPALAPTFVYAAGQYCTFRATIDGEPVARCYSMSSSPDVDEPLTTTVRRVPGGRMSNWMNDHLVAGDTIDVMRPVGRFVLEPRPDDVPIVAFAGGSGITPVLSIVKSALATTARPITLVYANRSEDCVIFAAELERLHDTSGGRLTVHHHYDAHRGFLDAPRCASLVDGRAHGDFYVCGPGPFMDVVEAGLATLGVDPARVRSERFVVPVTEPATADGTEGAADAAASVTESVVIRFERRKHTLAYQAGDTILETARRGGLQPPFSCESGSCATCMAHLDAGTVTMRVNNALSPDEVAEGWVLTCQSLPTSAEVVVDYDA